MASQGGSARPPNVVGMADLLELAISSQDVGTVNFNLLRLLLDDMVKKLSKTDKEPIKLGENDANQIANYKNYIQGAPVSPMPGILRYNQGQKPPQDGQGPVTPRTARPPNPENTRASAGAAVPGTSKAAESPGRSPRPTLTNAQLVDHGLISNLQEKIQDLEQQMKVITALPEHKELITKLANQSKDAGGNPNMSVNDMWQLIQLNNRIAAAEAAIQKMATLIEDLAKGLNRVRGDTVSVQADTGTLVKRNSELELQLSPLSDKFTGTDKKVDELKADVYKIKEELGQMKYMTGIDPRNFPSFMPKPGQPGPLVPAQPGLQLGQLPPQVGQPPQVMRPGPAPVGAQQGQIPPGAQQGQVPQGFQPGQLPQGFQPGQTPQGYQPGQAPQFQPGQGFQPGQMPPAGFQPVQFQPGQVPQGFQPGQMPPGYEQGQIQPPPTFQPGQMPMGFPPPMAPAGFDVSTLSPEQLAQMSPQQLAALSPQMFAKLTPQQMSQLTPDQISKMNPQQLAQLTPGKIQKLTLEQLDNITPAQMQAMPPEQREFLLKSKEQKRQKAKATKSGSPPNVNAMTDAEISALSPNDISRMTPADAAKIKPENLAKMTSDQRKQVEKAKQASPPGTAGKEEAIQSLDVDSLSAEGLAQIPVNEIEHMTAEQLAKLTPDKLNKMGDEKKKRVEKIKKKKPDIESMTVEEVADIPLTDFRHMSATFLQNLTDEQLGKFTPDQQKQVKRVIKAKSLKDEAGPDFHAMDAEQIAEIPVADLAQMTQSQAANITEEVLSNMTEEQKVMVEKRRSTKPPTIDEISSMDADQIALIPVVDFNNLTAEAVEKLTPEILAKMTAEQRERIEEIGAGRPRKVSFEAPKFEEMTPTEVAEIPVETLEKMTKEQIENISDEVKAMMTPEQLRKMEELIASLHYTTDDDTQYLEQSPSSAPMKAKKKKVHRRMKPKTADKLEEGAEEFIEVPKPKLGEHIEILTMDGYLATLGKDDLENMAANAVQLELQRQYAQLQGLQTQLAKDIQEKMEIIYQKLLREIITQQLTSSPYTVIDGEEKCMGPGICKGHGMPAGIAVCQYPDPSEPSTPEKPKSSDAECPTCGKDEALKSLRRPRKDLMNKNVNGAKGSPRSFSPSGRVIGLSPEGDQGKEGGVVSFDLEKLRNDLRMIDFGEFDEKDTMERIGALWEAVKVLKNNEANLQAKINKHDAVLKKLPTKAEKMTAKSPMLDSAESTNPTTAKDNSITPTSAMDVSKPDEKGDEAVDKDDIQTLFNNLANVIAECADQKERIDQLVDAVRIIESGMVTKQFLMDMISEKADKGQINTKVSYDEFGNTVDELHNQLHNLMVEGYQRNENWKKVTADLSEELAEKLDKIELAPIRAFFKSRLKKVEDRVQTLSALLEEPDPAGTRKKLLRDYNCISCDRRVNISGATNTCTLPVLGPSSAMPSAASHRAYDLHRLRTQRTKFDAEAKEIAALEKQRIHEARASAGLKTDSQLSSRDMMQLVNRYVGPNPASVPPPQALPSSPQQAPQSVAERVSPTTIAEPETEEEEMEMVMEIMEE